jgi:(+)-trans-carveol dehydrogenase
MPLKLEGKVALVTGAARGQGRSHALRLAAEGADIIALDICRQVGSVPYPMGTPEDLAETEALVTALDRRIVTGRVDVRDQPAMRAFVDQGVDELGRLDVVAANAGISSFGELHEMSEQTWHDMIDTNLTGVWNTVRVAVPHILAGGRGGSVIITSSAAGLRPLHNIGHYVAAKHGLVGLMRTLALELGPHGIRVNSLHPGTVETPMVINDATIAQFRVDSENSTTDDFARRSQDMHVLPVPWVQPQDISAALVFLASDDARYITGVTLPVDAGNLLK